MNPKDPFLSMLMARPDVLCDSDRQRDAFACRQFANRINTAYLLALGPDVAGSPDPIFPLEALDFPHALERV